MAGTFAKKTAVAALVLAVGGLGLAGAVLSPGSARRARISGQTAPGAPPGLAVLPRSADALEARARAATPLPDTDPAGSAGAPSFPASDTASSDGRDTGPSTTNSQRAVQTLPTVAGDKPARAASGSGDEPKGFRDRGGFGPEFAAAINRELFPLASECIELAVARSPNLTGLLAVEIEVVPIDGDRALVAAVEPTERNEIDDPELFECVEQSSFAVEDLPRATTFELTMPIGPDERQP